MDRALLLIETNQWNTLLDEIQRGLIDVNGIQNGLSLLVHAFLGHGHPLAPMLLKLGANPNYVFQDNGIPKTLLDHMIQNGALTVPRRPLRSYEEIVGTLSTRIQQGDYLLLRSYGALTLREITERGISEVVVTKDLPNEFSRTLIDFVYPRPPAQGKALSYYQQRQLEQEATQGLLKLQGGKAFGKRKQKVSGRKRTRKHKSKSRK